MFLTYTVDSIILLSFRKLKRVNLFWSNMLLANDTSGYVVLHQDVAQALHLVVGVKVMHIMVQSIHPILVDGKP